MVFSYVTLVFGQYGGLLSVRNRRVSMVHSNPLWGPRRNLVVPCSMLATATIAVVNLYGRGLQTVFNVRPIPGMFWGLPFSFALGILMMDELRKLIVRTYPKVRCCVRVLPSWLADSKTRPVFHCLDCVVNLFRTMSCFRLNER